MQLSVGKLHRPAPVPNLCGYWAINIIMIASCILSMPKPKPHLLRFVVDLSCNMLFDKNS